MRNPTERSPSSSSSASTSSISARESASRSSAKDEASVMRRRVGLEDVRQLVPDQLEHSLPVERASIDVGLCGHVGSCTRGYRP